MAVTKGLYTPQCGRNGKGYIGAYLPMDAKRRLVAAAELRGSTLSQLLTDVADNALSVAAALPPAQETQNRGAVSDAQRAAVPA